MNYCSSEYVRVIDTSFVQNSDGQWDAESENPWITFSFLSKERADVLCDVVIRTLGWSVRCDSETNIDYNPQTVVLSVSSDAIHFKPWGTFQADIEKGSGTYLFSCAPLAVILYPYLSFTVSSVFAGGVENTSRTHLSKIFMYSDEASNTPFKPPPNSIVSTLFIGGKTNEDSGSMSDSTTETEELANRLSEALASTEIRKTTPVMPKEKPHVRYSIAQSVAQRRKTVSFQGTELEMNTQDISEIIDQDGPTSPSHTESEANLYLRGIQSDVVVSESKKATEESKSIHHHDRALIDKREYDENENSRLKERVSELEKMIETLIGEMKNKEGKETVKDEKAGHSVETNKLPFKHDVDKQIVTALTDMSTMVCEAFQKVESRHASFIEGFALLAGQSPTNVLEVKEMNKRDSGKSSVTRNQDNGIGVLSDIPIAPDLRQLRSDCNVTEIFSGQRSPISAVDVDYVPRKRKTRRRKISRSKFLPESTFLSSEYNDNEMNVIARELHNTIAKKSLKEAELKVLIDYQRKSRYHKEKSKFGTPKKMKPYDYQEDGIYGTRIITGKVDNHW